MAAEIKMPKLGLTMEEGMVVNWVKKPGDDVEAGEVVVEIESDKITNEVEAEDDGILGEIIVPEGETVPVGAVLGIIVQDEEEVVEERPKTETQSSDEDKIKKEETAMDMVDSKKDIVEKKTNESKEAHIASPRARKRAKELGIDLKNVKIQKGERITSEDVEIYLKEKEKAESELVAERSEIEGRKEDLSQMRKTIATRMTESWEAPHVYLRAEVNVDNLLNIKERYDRNNIKITLTDLIALTTVNSLREYPKLNANFVSNQLIYKDEINLGIAVAVENGLVVPVIKNAESLNLQELSSEINKKVVQARDDELTAEDFSGGTFSVSNLGMFGVDEFTAVINPPEVGILAVGKIQEKLVKKGEKIVSNSVMNVTLGIDHRVIDGAEGAKFLQQLKKHMENPELML